MNFFIHQPEILLTINFILGPSLGGFAAVSIFSAAFLLLALLGYFVARRYKWDRSTLIFALAALLWLPLLAQSIYSSFREFNDTWFTLGLREREQIIWRYCRIDSYQHLGGGFCELYPFIEHVRQTVPKNSRIALVTSNLWAYFNYYLYADYTMVEPAQADYILVYNSGPFDKKVLDGFEATAAFSNAEFIFKRIKK
jgi:hypothetical protein